MSICPFKQFTVIWLQESNGSIAVRLNEGSLEETIVQATINVTHCKHLHTTVQILGYHASVASQLSVDPLLAEIFGDDIFKSKSFALIYAHNRTRTEKYHISIGQRQPHDTLLRTDERTVIKEHNSFPEYEIVYNDANAFITHVQFIFNVSVYDGQCKVVCCFCCAFDTTYVGWAQNRVWLQRTTVQKYNLRESLRKRASFVGKLVMVA